VIVAILLIHIEYDIELNLIESYMNEMDFSIDTTQRL